MDEYIKKSTVLEEIDRRLKKYASLPEDDKLDAIYGGKCNELVSLFRCVDKIRGEEVDFEKMWKEYFKYRGDMATVNVKHLAKHFFELGLKAKGE